MEDPYENKLFQMFQSFDKEAIGKLSEVNLKSLCTALELRDNGAVLIQELVKHKGYRVSFEEFKDGLLHFLGSEMMDNNNRGDFFFGFIKLNIFLYNLL